MENNTERRYIDLTDSKIELRKDGDADVIEGYAIVFNRESINLGGFKEIIMRSAVEGVDFSQLVSFFNHDQRMILGKAKNKTLSVEVDDYGVKYRVSPPDTTYVRDLVENIKARNVEGSSFQFIVPKAGDMISRKADGTVLRTITKFDMVLEMGPVFNPAYLQTDTSVAKRSLDEFLKENPEKGEKEERFEENLVDLIELEVQMRSRIKR
jgi:uncharacterized protein